MKFLAGEVVLVAGNEVERKSISITQKTKDGLDAIKHVGQSYYGLIQEVVKFWQEKKGEHRTRREEKRSAKER